MSYRVYTTPGIVLKKLPSKEADVVLYILTHDLGLIIASAKATRKLSSKLGRFLEEYSHISVSAIKSKNGWKITNVSDIDNFYFSSLDNARVIIARTSSLLISMMPGEVPQPAIFETVETGFEILKSLEEKNIPHFEVVMVLRILHLLGYVATDSQTEIFVSNANDWNQDILERASENKTVLVGLINKALQESQLNV